MNVFLSYSARDTVMVGKVAQAVRPYADEVYWWHESQEPGKDAWESIFDWVEDSTIVLAIITDKTLSRAMSVGNEIGYARANNIKVIPLVAPGIKHSDLGCLNGTTTIPLDPEKVHDSLTKLIPILKREGFKEAVVYGLVGAAVGVLLGKALFGD